jgi:predicted Zn-dependent peptidase
MRSFHRKLRWLLAATLIATILSSAAFAKPLNIPVVYYKLPNGLRVVISEDHVAPVVTVAVYYNVGFRIEPKGRTGFAHLFEHMMFQGSANVKKFEHAKYVEANGGSLNGHTDFDYTNYFETLPSDRVEMGLWLESDRMRSLDVTPENLKNQQNVVSEEVRVNVLNQPYGLFEWIDLWGNANQNYYNSHNGYGDLKDIEAATLEDVRSFFKTYYAPNNAVLVVAGDIDVPQAKAMVQKYFAPIPRGPTPPPLANMRVPVTLGYEDRLVLQDAQAPAPAIYVAYRVPSAKDPRAPTITLLGDILGGGRSSRLYDALVRRQQVATNVAGFNFGLADGADMLVFNAVGKPGGNPDSLEKALLAELAGVSSFTQPELDRARASERFASTRSRASDSCQLIAPSLSTSPLVKRRPSLAPRGCRNDSRVERYWSHVSCVPKVQSPDRRRDCSRDGFRVRRRSCADDAATAAECTAPLRFSRRRAVPAR